MRFHLILVIVNGEGEEGEFSLIFLLERQKKRGEMIVSPRSGERQPGRAEKKRSLPLRPLR